MKEIGPRPRKYRMQGSLRISNPIYEKNYGFQVDKAITVAYLYFFSMSAFRLARPYNLRKRVWKEKLFWIRFCMHKVVGRERRKNLNSFQRMMAFCVSVERISGNGLCPIEDLKSKVSVCFSTPVLRVVPRGAENSDSDDPESVGGSCDKRQP